MISGPSTEIGPATMLKDIIGQHAPIHVLRRAIYSGRVAHAYLFAGPPNVGKTLTALWLAKTLNCERNVGFASAEEVDCCDECDTCRRFERLVHPDLMLLRPEKSVKVGDDGDDAEGEADVLEIEGSLITTGQVERLVEHSYLRAMQSRRKIYIITSAETMNKEAENRLLKTLEEPPPGTVLILTAANLSGLLPTTISRCQLLNFRPVPAGEAEECLRQRYPQVAPEQVHSLVALSGGRIGWAVSMLEHPEVLRVRADLLDLCLRMPSMPMVQCLQTGQRLVDTAERWWLATADPEIAEKALKSSRDRILRTRLIDVLDVLITWFRDLLLVHSDPNASQIINRDRLADLQRLAPTVNPETCRKACLYLEDMKQQLRRNANVRLACEMMALRLITASA